MIFALHAAVLQNMEITQEISGFLLREYTDKWHGTLSSFAES